MQVLGQCAAAGLTPTAPAVALQPVFGSARLTVRFWSRGAGQVLESDVAVAALVALQAILPI